MPCLLLCLPHMLFHMHACGVVCAAGSKQSLHAVLTSRARPAGLRCQARAEGSWCQGRATAGAGGGPAVLGGGGVVDDGLVRLGWAMRAAGELGTDRHGFGYGGTGKKSHERRFEDYGRPFGKARAAYHAHITPAVLQAGKCPSKDS